MNHSLDTNAILHRVNQPIAQATGLPNECYTDQASFLIDRETIFGPGWACIGFADQLPDANYSIPLDFMGLPLLVTRDNNNTIRVFHNVCSHRGMQLTDQPCKNNGTIRCPYHNWTYKLNGELHATPHVGGFGQHTHQDFNPQTNGLQEIRSVIWLGAIMINLSGKAPPFEQYAKSIMQRWRSFVSDEQLSRFNLSQDGSNLSLTVQSNWKLAVENFLEAYHLPSVHPELNRVSPLDEHYCMPEADNSGGQGSQNYRRLQINNQQLPAIETWPAEEANTSEYPALYPNTLLGIHADQLFVLFLQPVSQHETREHIRIFYVDTGATDEQYAEHRKRTLNGWQAVFEEDIFAVERMQKGRASPAYRGGAFSPAMDQPTHHFHKWVASKLASNDKSA